MSMPLLQSTSRLTSPAPRAPKPCLDVLPLTLLKEQTLRKAVVTEALKWVGTPYYHLGDRLGAGVDCCMLLIRAWVDAGVVEPFDPRPYPSHWNLHQNEERYLNWFKLCANEVPSPSIGDVVLWKFGRCYAHSGIYIGPNEVVHALADHRKCTRTSMDESFLKFLGRTSELRPVKYFDIFAKIREITV